MRKKFGRRVKNVPGMMQLNCDIRTTRQESYLFANVKYDVTELMKYLEKRKKNGDHITFFHAFLMGLGKVFYNRPVLNRFVKNRRIYEHPDVSFAFVAKVAFDDKAEEMMIQCKIDPDDNIDKISERLAKKVAREVAATKVEAKLDSMNSYERRIIHNALGNSKKVYTESEGEEPNRYVVIKPKEE